MQQKNMFLIKDKDKEDLARFAFERFSHEVHSIAEKKEKISVALCGGNSVGEFYEELGKNLGKFPFEKIHFFMLDERLDKSQRNSNLLKEKILGNTDDTEKYFSRFHLLEDKTVEGYDKEFRGLFPETSFDIVIASAGEDGHVASLFPKHKLLDEGKKGYAYLDDSPKAPAERITLLPNSLLDTRVSLVFFIGENKKKALKDYLAEDSDEVKAPVNMLKRTKNYVFTDIKL